MSAEIVEHDTETTQITIVNTSNVFMSVVFTFLSFTYKIPMYWFLRINSYLEIKIE
jgi:hypothetical protein